MAARRRPCSSCGAQVRTVYARQKVALGARSWVAIGTVCTGCEAFVPALGWRLLLAP